MRRRPPPPGSVEPPAELRHFDPERWAEPDDHDPFGDYPPGRHRWFAERMAWAEANGVSMLDWIKADRDARRAREAADWANRQADDGGRGDDG